MKNHLTRAIVFIVLGVALFTVSTLSTDSRVEKWSSFMFGFSFPLFVFGIVAIAQYFRKKKTDSIND
jgi:predicted membrane channel-forming protein YqfA (hemolysin III family)